MILIYVYNVLSRNFFFILLICAIMQAVKHSVQCLAYVCFFSKSANKDPDPAVLISGRKLLFMNEYKYLSIVIDSKLTSKRL